MDEDVYYIDMYDDDEVDTALILEICDRLFNIWEERYYRGSVKLKEQICKKVFIVKGVTRGLNKEYMARMVCNNIIGQITNFENTGLTKLEIEVLLIVLDYIHKNRPLEAKEQNYIGKLRSQLARILES